jgi:hypothetical protein
MQDIKIIKELFSKKDIDLKTELTHEQIADLCVLLHFSDRCKSKAMKAFANNFMKLQVSKKRQGRGEFIKAIHGYQDSQKERGMNEIEKGLR